MKLDGNGWVTEAMVRYESVAEIKGSINFSSESPKTLTRVNYRGIDWNNPPGRFFVELRTLCAVHNVRFCQDFSYGLVKVTIIDNKTRRSFQVSATEDEKYAVVSNIEGYSCKFVSLLDSITAYLIDLELARATATMVKERTELLPSGDR